MDIRYSKSSLKFLAKLDKKSALRIRNAINGLVMEPPVGDIKPMEGYHDGTKRLRVGNWRVIYRYGKDKLVEVLFVLDIGNRGDVYK